MGPIPGPKASIPHISPVWSRLLDTIIVGGEGAYDWDQADRRYVDFSSGIGVTNRGHCHLRLVAAIRQQAGRILHVPANLAYHEPMLALVAALGE